MEDKVLIINTGGTIGMVGKPLRPAYNWSEITKGYSMLEKFPTDYYQFEKLIDSSDVTTDFWIKLVEVIEKNYDKSKESYHKAILFAEMLNDNVLVANLKKERDEDLAT